MVTNLQNCVIIFFEYLPKIVKDIKDKTLRSVGNPDDRFSEDALRMLRAVRFACQLDFSVAYEVVDNIVKNSELIKNISQESKK